MTSPTPTGTGLAALDRFSFSSCSWGEDGHRDQDDDDDNDNDDGDDQEDDDENNDDDWMMTTLTQVAATPNNSLCAVGVAFDAQIGGIRMLDGQVLICIQLSTMKGLPNFYRLFSLHNLP